MLSRTGENPPEVPCPPHMGMDPAAMPSRGSSPMSLDAPREIRFWQTISAATRMTRTTNGRPPLLKAFMFDWNPTEVKNTVMQMSLIVPSKENSRPPR